MYCKMWTFIAILVVAHSTTAATDVTLTQLEGVWEGTRSSAAYTRFDTNTRRYSGGCLPRDEEILAAFSESKANISRDIVISNASIEIQGDDYTATYSIPVTRLDNAVVASGLDMYQSGFNGSILSFANGLANVSIPAQQDVNATTACVRIDVMVNKSANAVIMKTTQLFRMLFSNGTIRPLPSQCPSASSSSRPVCTDSRSATAPAAAPTGITARTPTAAPAPRPSANSTSANTTTRVDHFTACVRPSLTLDIDQVPTCLAYLAYALQTPFAQLEQPSTTLTECYEAISSGNDLSSSEAIVCTRELRSLYNATINSSRSSAQSFCTASSFDNCAACTWCRTNVQATEACNSDCTTVSDFPDISMDGDVYTIYPGSSNSPSSSGGDDDEEDGDYTDTTTPNTTPSDSSTSTISTDPSTINAIQAILDAIGGSTGGRKLLQAVPAAPLGAPSRTTTSLPAGSYIITSTVTSELKCAEGACLDLLAE